jgi:hypothetical protein
MRNYGNVDRLLQARADTIEHQRMNTMLVAKIERGIAALKSADAARFLRPYLLVLVMRNISEQTAHRLHRGPHVRACQD